MAIFSTLTPVFLAVLCILIALILKNFNRSKKKPKTDSKPPVPSRPWVDEDLQDDTEINPDEGKQIVYKSCRFNYQKLKMIK